jgi:hypothetical protein
MPLVPTPAVPAPLRRHRPQPSLLPLFVVATPACFPLLHCNSSSPARPNLQTLRTPLQSTTTHAGYFLDFKFTSRRKRGLAGVVVVAVLGTAIWGGGLANQLKYSHGDLAVPIDFRNGRSYAGPFLLYFSYGLLDAMFQSLIYWIIGALANDSEILSR